MENVIWDYKEISQLGNDTKRIFRDCYMYLNGAFLNFNEEGAVRGERGINNALACAKLLLTNLGKKDNLPESSNFEMSEDYRSVSLKIRDALLAVEEEVFGTRTFTTREKWQETFATIEGYAHRGKRPVKDDIKTALGIENKGLMQRF